MARTTYMGRVLPTLKSRREMSPGIIVAGGTAPTADPARARPSPALRCSLPRRGRQQPEPPQPACNGTGALASNGNLRSGRPEDNCQPHTTEEAAFLSAPRRLAWHFTEPPHGHSSRSFCREPCGSKCLRFDPAAAENLNKLAGMFEITTRAGVGKHFATDSLRSLRSELPRALHPRSP